MKLVMPCLAMTLVLYHSVLAEGRWEVAKIGTHPSGGTFHNLQCVTGNARGDGKPGVYVVGAGLAEWRYENDTWNLQTFPSMESMYLHSVDIGNGRNDGAARLYGGGNEYAEVSYSGSWDIGDLPMSGWTVSVKVGDGRNDGIQRVYCGGSGVMRELTWNGSGWDALDLDNQPFYGTIDIGQARNDGVNRM